MLYISNKPVEHCQLHKIFQLEYPSTCSSYFHRRHDNMETTNCEVLLFTMFLQQTKPSKNKIISSLQTFHNDNTMYYTCYCCEWLVGQTPLNYFAQQNS